MPEITPPQMSLPPGAEPATTQVFEFFHSSLVVEPALTARALAMYRTNPEAIADAAQFVASDGGMRGNILGNVVQFFGTGVDRLVVFDPTTQTEFNRAIHGSNTTLLQATRDYGQLLKEERYATSPEAKHRLAHAARVARISVYASRLILQQSS